MDGTLIDSGRLHYFAFRETVSREYGLEYLESDFYPLYGRSAEEIIKPFLQNNGIDASLSKEFADKRRDVLKKQLGEVTSIPLLSGAIQTLDTLKDAGFKLALATGNRRVNGEIMVEKAGLKKYFPVRIYHDDISRGKPDPEIFLKAAQELGFEPKECAVFEDSVHGVESAKSAGMKVVAVASGGHTLKDLSGKKPDLTLKTLKDFKINQLNGL